MSRYQKKHSLTHTCLYGYYTTSLINFQQQTKPPYTVLSTFAHAVPLSDFPIENDVTVKLPEYRSMQFRTESILEKV